MMNLNRLGLLLILLFTFIIYRFFISTDFLVASDWPLFFRESRDFLPFWSIAWDYMGQGGIGGPAFKTSWIDLYTNFVYFISNLTNIPWWISQRIFWIFPFVAISLFSSYKFSSLFIKDNLLRAVSSLIYSFNTYILLIVAGGQFGIAFSYALAPFVLFSFVNFYKNLNKKNIILHGLLFGIMVAFDPRIAFLAFLVEVFWFMVFVQNFKKFYLFLLSFLIAFLINFYWILPLIVFRDSSSVFSGYTSLEGVKFLSFANFSNSISLLHPNWPENIFGKTYFLRPEFLILPILAFGTLLIKVKKEVLFFAVIALIGAFLGKGTNEPFREAYLFLFQLPGFNLFRDSTKFFILIALSYSILIPYFLENLKKLKKVSVILFILFWLLILKPVWSGELTGIFNPKQLPQDYLKLNQFIAEDKNFSRILWIPKRQKYGFFDPSHPAVDSETISKKTDFKENELQELGIKYVIVPYDSEGEIFLDDRKYNEKKRREVELELDKVSWLKKINRFNDLNHFSKITVYEIENPRDRFWSPNESLMIRYKFINPTKHIVDLRNAKRGDLLVFSEGFDKKWQLEQDTIHVSSKQYNKTMNSFTLPKSGNYEFTIYYYPQRYVEVGLWVSGSTVLASIGYILFGKIRKKW